MKKNIAAASLLISSYPFICMADAKQAVSVRYNFNEFISQPTVILLSFGLIMSVLVVFFYLFRDKQHNWSTEQHPDNPLRPDYEYYITSGYSPLYRKYCFDDNGKN